MNDQNKKYLWKIIQLTVDDLINKKYDRKKIMEENGLDPKKRQ